MCFLSLAATSMKWIDAKMKVRARICAFFKKEIVPFSSQKVAALISLTYNIHVHGGQMIA